MPPAAAAAAAEESESQPLTGQSAGAEPAPATPLPQPEKLQPDGLPDMSDEDEVDAETWCTAVLEVLKSPLCPIPVSPFLAVFVVVTLLIAFAIHAIGSTATYDAKIAALGADAGWTFLTAVLFSRAVLYLNFFPMKYKKKIMRGSSGNIRTNMAIYKALDNEGKSHGQAIVMAAEGDVGRYNRANRSLAHFTETAPAVVVLLALVAPVFPFPGFVLTALYCLGRVLHMRGEAKGYGSHGVGFALSMAVTLVLEGLCTVAACKGFGGSLVAGDAVLL